MKPSKSFTDHIIGNSDGECKLLLELPVTEIGVQSQSVLIPDRRSVWPRNDSEIAAWVTISAFISSKPNFRVIVLSQDLERDAKQVKNVKAADHTRLCVGATASNREEVRSRFEELKHVRGPFRLLVLRVLSEMPDIGFSPDCVDWIICDPESGPTSWIDEIENVCHDTGIAFLRLDGMQNQDSVRPWHPFGQETNLRMPRAAYEASEVREIPVEVLKSGAREALFCLGDSNPPATIMSAGDRIESDDEMLAEFHRLDQIVERGVAAAFEACRALHQISEQELWRVAGYSTWEAYCIGERGLTKQRVNQKIKAAKVMNAITPLLQAWRKASCLPTNEGQVRELHCLEDPQKQAQACVIAASEANGKLSARHLADAANKLLGKDIPKAKQNPTRYQKNVTDVLRCLGRAIRSDQEHTHVLKLVESLKEAILRQDSSS